MFQLCQQAGGDVTLCPVKELIMLATVLSSPAVNATIPKELALPRFIDRKALSSLTGIKAVGCVSCRSLFSPAVLKSMHPGKARIVSWSDDPAPSNADSISVISLMCRKSV